MITFLIKNGATFSLVLPKFLKLVCKIISNNFRLYKIYCLRYIFWNMYTWFPLLIAICLVLTVLLRLNGIPYFYMLRIYVDMDIIICCYLLSHVSVWFSIHSKIVKSSKFILLYTWTGLKQLYCADEGQKVRKALQQLHRELCHFFFSVYTYYSLE